MAGNFLGLFVASRTTVVGVAGGRSPAMRSFFARATQFRPLLVTFCLTIHLHLHLQSNHCLFRLSLSIQSRPVFGRQRLFHHDRLIWSRCLFFVQPSSLGAWGAAVGDTGLTLPTLTASN